MPGEVRIIYSGSRVTKWYFLCQDRLNAKLLNADFNHKLSSSN